ncbi:hypothetical protein GEMRC1_012501 [Eukaryota sp. GEM-RC1]
MSIQSHHGLYSHTFSMEYFVHPFISVDEQNFVHNSIDLFKTGLFFRGCGNFFNSFIFSFAPYLNEIESWESLAASDLLHLTGGDGIGGYSASAQFLNLMNPKFLHCLRFWKAIMPCFKGSFPIRVISAELRDNEEFWRLIFTSPHLSKKFQLLQWLSERFKDNEDFCRLAVSHECHCFQACSERLRDNEDFCRFAVSCEVELRCPHISCVIPKCSERLRRKLDFAEFAVSKNQDLRSFFPSSLFIHHHR